MMGDALTKGNGLFFMRIDRAGVSFELFKF